MRLRTLAATAALAVLIPLGLAGPSSADPGNPFDVTVLGSKAVVKGGTCRNLPVTVRHNGPLHEYFNVDVESQVWHGDDYTGSVTDYTGGDTLTMSSSYLWCPYEGLGTFRVGPTAVSWSDFRGDEYLDGKFTDTSTTTLTVRQWSATNFAGAKASKIKGKRYLTVSGRYRYYSVDQSGIRPATGVAMTLQRASGSRWKSVRTVRTNARGLSSVRIPAAKAASYRWVTAATWATWGATSSTLRR